MPSKLGIALCKNVPVDADTGSLSVGQEINGAGYVRYYYTPGAVAWVEMGGGSGQVYNGSSITFAVASGDWGYVSGVAICDHETAGSGNMLVKAALTTPKIVGNGDTFKFNIGDLTVSCA